MKLSILILAAAGLAVACGGSVAASRHVAVHRAASTAILSPLLPAPSPAAATAAEPPVLTTPAPGAASPAASAVSTHPAAPAKPPAPVPPPRPIPAPTAPPQAFLVVTVDNAPAMNCGTPIDCEASYAYAMAHFQIGERLPYTRVLTDARGQRFYILGPWTPVGLLPIADGRPS